MLNVWKKMNEKVGLKWAFHNIKELFYNKMSLPWVNEQFGFLHFLWKVMKRQNKEQIS